MYIDIWWRLSGITFGECGQCNKQCFAHKACFMVLRSLHTELSWTNMNFKTLHQNDLFLLAACTCTFPGLMAATCALFIYSITSKGDTKVVFFVIILFYTIIVFHPRLLRPSAVMPPRCLPTGMGAFILETRRTFGTYWKWVECPGPSARPGAGRRTTQSPWTVFNVLSD